MNAVSKRSLTGMHRGGKATETFPCLLEPGVKPERWRELRAVRSGIVIIWLNTPIQMQFRIVDRLTVRFAESGDQGDDALLLSPWPESLLAFERPPVAPSHERDALRA
jgi:hypothetical protein